MLRIFVISGVYVVMLVYPVFSLIVDGLVWVAGFAAWFCLWLACLRYLVCILRTVCAFVGGVVVDLFTCV